MNCLWLRTFIQNIHQTHLRNSQNCGIVLACICHFEGDESPEIIIASQLRTSIQNKKE